MTRPLPLALALFVASGALADVTPFDKEEPRLLQREQAEGVNPIARRAVMLRVDSGPVAAPVDASAQHPQQVPVWSTEVEIPDAAWVRLRFGDVTLAPRTGTARESYLRITSLYDGHEQYLDRDSLREWSYTSAYFNGGRVRVELMASPDADPAMNRVEVVGATASEPTAFPRSICGTVDDRVLSSDPRDARLMPIGCTVWLFGDQPNSFLTAGHCAPGAGDVVQFNVPLSSAGGSPQNPGPEDQYPVDGSSSQYASGVIGGDWGFFGTFDNSNTGLAPGEAMGDSHVLTTALPPVDGRPIRITGYGSTTAPVSPTWYLVQKTHVGPFSAISGTIIQYATDTTGGNSGSAIVDENSNVAIGIHTHAGCSSSGGANQGTSLFLPALQAALANPMGVTMPLGLEMGFVDERPETLLPRGTSVTISVAAAHGQTPSGQVTLHTPQDDIAMTHWFDDAYTGRIPGGDCGETVSYWFTAQDTDGGTWRLPRTGAYQGIIANDLITAIADDFQTDQGWTVQNVSLSTGAWVRAVPGNYGRSDPASDADGSGMCYVTGNGNQEDVDGGPTYLVSPPIDISNLGDPRVSYARWHETNGDDVLVVEFSTNNGVSWTPVETVGTGSGWTTVEHRVSDFVPTGGTLMVRFTSSDNPNTYVTESGVDAFKVYDVWCLPNCPADLFPGEVGDGVLDFHDVVTFLSNYNNQYYPADFAEPFGVYNYFDVAAFLTAYNAGCP